MPAIAHIPASERPPTDAQALAVRIVTAAWAGVIFLMSSLPGSALPGRFGAFGHLGEYAILGALLIVSLRQGNDDRVGVLIAAIALCAAWGATDELHQAFVPLRVPDAVDWLVDVAGATAGSALALAALALRAAHDGATG